MMAMSATRAAGRLGLLLAAAMLACALQGCAGGARTKVEGITPEKLVGSQWLLEDLGGAGVLDRVQATLAFPQPGQVAGNASCNRFSGSITDNGGLLKVGPLGSTRMGCAPAVNAQETKYLAALEGVERIATEGAYLLVYTRALPKPLRYTRLK